ncbi:MAG: hypothetical protein WD119_02230 [Pirellulaceae bacterium]
MPGEDSFRAIGDRGAGLAARRFSLPRDGTLLFLLFLLAGLPGNASSQEPPASHATVPYRRIFFFQDEAARLIPPDFRAVAVDDLQSLLLQPAAVVSPDDGKPRLKAAEYWVSFDEGTLHSDNSKFAISYRDDAPGELDLGMVNLALRDKENGSADVQPPYLHTASDGTLRAAISRDCDLQFGWSLGKQPTEDATYHFELLIPPCGTAPLFLDLPRDHRLSATNGIPLSLTGPPPEASNEAMESPRRWYKIEAGGLHRLTIDIVAEASFSDEVIVPIRQQSTAFRIAPAGVRWTTQMTIERLEENVMPPLNVGETRITSVRVDGQPAEWKELPTVRDSQETRIQLIPPREFAERSRSVTTNIAISGTAPLVTDDSFELPYPRWEDCYPAMMMPNWQTQLTVDRDLTLARLDLPEDWDADSVELSEDGDVSYQISGPSRSREQPRIQLIHSEVTLTADAALRLDVMATQIEANWDARINLGDEGPRPLRIQVEPQWRIDSIVLPTSERVVEVPAEIGERRILTLWPEAADLQGNTLRLRIGGHRLNSTLPPVGQRGEPQVPATWFVRMQDCRVDAVAAINPPVGWRWPGESIIRSQTISEDELSEATRSMLGNISSKTLLFTLPQDSTPTLKLERPLPVVEADVTLSLRRDESIITETLTLNLHTPGDAFSEVRVRTGPAHGRPPLSWSLAGSATQTGPLASLDEGTNRSSDDETWVIFPPANRGGELVLIGRRRYRIDQLQRIDLPTVAQALTHQSAVEIAANQETSVLIGRNLHVRETSGPVQRIPATSEDPAGWRRLRYDPSEPAAIVLTKLDYSPAPEVIWEERVQVHTSARWGDTIVAEYETDGRRPLRIQFDSAMTLEEASTSGRPFVLSEITSDRDAVLIPASSEKQRLRLQFRRPTKEGGLTRWWKPPLIRPEAIVLRSQWSLHPVADTVVPEWNRGWVSGDIESPIATGAKKPSEGIILSSPSDGLWLVANEGCWAFGTGIALLAFSLAWWTARHHGSFLLATLAAVACLTIWWPQAALALSGFVAMPIIAGGLLEIATRRLTAAKRKGKIDSRRDSESARLSVTPGSTMILIVCLGFAGLATETVGQDASSASLPSENNSPDADGDAEREPLEKGSVAYPILIPVDEEGEPAGSTVYIPESMYDTLFLRSMTDQKPSDLRLRQANYRVRLGGNGIAYDSQTVRVDVRLTVQSDRAGQEIRLPFSASIVQSTEVVLDDSTRTIRWLPSGDGISLMLPRRGINQLRIALLPEVRTESNDVSTLRLSIPPVMRSQLVLDSDTPLQTADVEPCNGEIQLDASAGRLSADLGPVDSIGLRWQFRRDLDLEAAAPLIRRWLVHVGVQKVITECEVDLSTLMTAAGDEVQLDLYHEASARVTSRDWKMISLEPYEAMRRRLTIQATKSSPRPVRLMWESDIETLEVAADGGPASRMFTPPNVRPVRPVPLGRSFIAIDADPRIQVDLAADSAAEIENDRFLEGWTPRVDLIDRAYVTESAPPRLTLTRPAAIPWQAEERQHLHVSLDNGRGHGRLALDYRADVIPGDRAVGPMRLMLPPGMRVQQLKLDGQAISSTPRATADALELSLPDLAPREAFQLELQGWMPLASSHRFRPPRVVLAPVDSVTGFYLMTRGSNVMIQQREATGLPKSEVTIPNSTRLSDGIVPRWSWRLEGSELPDRPTLPGMFEVTPNTTIINASQITDLFWQDGRWSMETVFDIVSKHGQIDFLAFELPTRWSEELEIAPAISWSIQPAAEPTKRLVRILPEDPASGRQQIRIRSRLRSSDSGQVSVPDVRLLGEGERHRFIGVPSRLTNDPINWDTNGANLPQRPEVFQNMKGIDENQKVYQVSGNWYAKLEPATATRRQATATAMDVQLFPQQDQSILAICRWDLLPADRSDVQIQMPPGAEPLGVWSAGFQASDSRTNNLLNVPLNLSRLGQSVELLVRLEQQKPDSDLTLPQLVDVPVQTSWVARYAKDPGDRESDQPSQLTGAPPDSSEPGSSEADDVGWRFQTASARGLALGESIADVLEGSLDSLAQRPNDEIAAWLLPWLDRAERVLPNVDGNESAERLEQFTSSVLGTSDISPYRTSSSRYWFSIASEDWSPGLIATRPGQADAIPTSFLRASPKLSWWEPERVAAAIGLLIFALVFWRLRGLLSPLIASPAFWLFCVGLVGLLLAPLPVAITICLIALVSPWLPAARRSHQR